MCLYQVTEFACGHDFLISSDLCFRKSTSNPYPHLIPCKTREVVVRRPGYCAQCEHNRRENRKSGSSSWKDRLESAKLKAFGAPQTKLSPVVPIQGSFDWGFEDTYGPQSPKIVTEAVGQWAAKASTPSRPSRPQPDVFSMTPSKIGLEKTVRGNRDAKVSPVSRPGPRASPRSWEEGDDAAWQRIPLSAVPDPRDHGLDMSGVDNLINKPIVSPISVISDLDTLPSQKPITAATALGSHPIHKDSIPRREQGRPESKTDFTQYRPQNERKLATGPRVPPKDSAVLGGKYQQESTGTVRRKPLPVSGAHLSIGSQQKPLAGKHSTIASPRSYIAREQKQQKTIPVSRADEQAAELFFEKKFQVGSTTKAAGLPTEIHKIPSIVHAGQRDTTYKAYSVGEIPTHYNGALKLERRKAKLSTAEEQQWAEYLNRAQPAQLAPEIVAHSKKVCPAQGPAEKDIGEKIHMYSKVSRPGLHDYYSPPAAIPAALQPRLGGRVDAPKSQGLTLPRQLPSLRGQSPMQFSATSEWNRVVARVMKSAPSVDTLV